MMEMDAMSRLFPAYDCRCWPTARYTGDGGIHSTGGLESIFLLNAGYDIIDVGRGTYRRGYNLNGLPISDLGKLKVGISGRP